MNETQNYKNHAKLVPAYHMFAYPMIAVYFSWSLLRAVRQPSWDTAIQALLGAGLIVMLFYARSFALKVQDRVIRLEMRLRMRELLPADLTARIPEFTTAQLVSLRFASDAELPALARRVLEERLNDRKAIKLMIRDWQADNLRA